MNSSRKIKKEVKRIISDFIKLNSECYKRNRHLHYLYKYFLSNDAIYKVPNSHLEEFMKQLKKMEKYSIDKSRTIQYREAYCYERLLTKSGKSVSLRSKQVYDYWYLTDNDPDQDNRAFRDNLNKMDSNYNTCFVEGMRYNEAITVGKLPLRIKNKSFTGIKFLTSVNGNVISLSHFIPQSFRIKTNIAKFVNKRKSKNKSFIFPFIKQPKSLSRITKKIKEEHNRTTADS